MKLGLTLPSFVQDPAVPLAVASAAEGAGLDGVFAYDHLFRVASDGSRRPALECTTLLGAIAAETARVALGTLVIRATLRPPATLAVALDAVQRISGGRVLATIGAGDRESRVENESYGLAFGSERDRLERLADAIVACRGRGYPVWVGGSARHVGAVAGADADGWNRWGPSPEVFAAEAAEVRGLTGDAGRDPGALTLSWGGLFVLGVSDAAARAKAERLGAGPNVAVGGPERVAARLRAYGDAGAEWVMVGPVDSSDPENAEILGTRVAPLLV